ncbi:hypothetical protein Efla_003530 [Eimeria flavescens]
MSGPILSHSLRAEESRIMLYTGSQSVGLRLGSASIPALRLTPPAADAPLEAAPLSHLAELVDADDCLSRLPPVEPAEAPDYKDLEMAMRKAWDTPIVQWHLEHTMKREELLHVWHSRPSGSPRLCGSSFICRQSPRRLRISSLHSPACKCSGGPPVPAVQNGARSATVAPASLFNEETGRCFLEFQALGTQILTTQTLLEEKCDSYLTGVRDSTLVERAGSAVQRLIDEAEAIRDYCRGVFLRWKEKAKEKVFDEDEGRNALCLKGLERLVKAAVYAHLEMSAFISRAKNAALQEAEKAEAAAAEVRRVRDLRIAAVRLVALDDIIPFEVYLVFTPLAFPFNALVARRPKNRPFRSERKNCLLRFAFAFSAFFVNGIYI